MAKEMILLSKRQFDDLSRQVDKSNLDQVENGRNDGKGSVETNTTLSDASDMNRTFIENCTQTGKGFVFHQQESGDSVEPPVFQQGRNARAIGQFQLCHGKNKKQTLTSYNIDFYYKRE